jgi:hypothetical protein
MFLVEDYGSGSDASDVEEKQEEGAFSSSPPSPHFIPQLHPSTSLGASTLSSSDLISSSTTLIIPTLSTYPLTKLSSSNSLIKYNQKELLTNPTLDIVLAPSQGPAHPYRFNAAAQSGIQQVGMGQIEEAAMEDWAFDDQYQTYLRNGYALDPSSNAVLGDVNAYLLATYGDSDRVAKGLSSRHPSSPPSHRSSPAFPPPPGSQISKFEAEATRGRGRVR